MNNLHQKSKLLSNDRFSELEKVFEMAWVKKTALPKSQEKWSKNNRAHGQCAITALIVQDMFGGNLITNTDGSHFWNELPDRTQQDFTRKQFKKPKNLIKYIHISRGKVLNNKGAKLSETRKRYLILKKLFSKLSNSFE